MFPCNLAAQLPTTAFLLRGPTQYLINDRSAVPVATSNLRRTCRLWSDTSLVPNRTRRTDVFARAARFDYFRYRLIAKIVSK